MSVALRSLHFTPGHGATMIALGVALFMDLPIIRPHGYSLANVDGQPVTSNERTSVPVIISCQGWLAG